MYKEIFQRNELYWGDGFQNYLKSRYVAVIGVGGVGAAALEALSRLGISNFLIADFDKISLSNINRQLIALKSQAGLKKTDVAKKRLLDINPEIKLKIYDDFIDVNSFDEIFKEKPDFIVDAIDTVSSKVALLKYAKDNNIRIISSFGAGNRMDGSKLYVCDVSEIENKDSFVKNLLSKLKKYAGIEKDLLVVTSREKPFNIKKIKNVEKIHKENGEIIEITKYTPASNAIVPNMAGFLAANKILEIFYKEYIG